MSEYCYIIDDEKGGRLYLSDEGPEQVSIDIMNRLSEDDFRHVNDRRIGLCVLHVFERAMMATDIVHEEK